MRMLIVLALTCLFTVSCSDSGVFDSSNNNDGDVFKDIPVSTKPASQQEISDAAAIATMIATIDQTVTRADSFSQEIHRFIRLGQQQSDYSSLANGLQNALERCHLETVSRSNNGNESVEYSFTPGQSCPFNLSGSFSQAKGTVGPGNVKGAPYLDLNSDKMTLTANSLNQTNIQQISMSWNSKTETKSPNEVGRTNSTDLKQRLVGTIVLNDGTILSFQGAKSILSNNTKVSDQRYVGSDISDFQLGFVFEGKIIHYQEYSRQNSEKNKDNINLRKVNGIALP